MTTASRPLAGSDCIIDTGELMYDLNLKWVLAHLLLSTNSGLIGLPTNHPIMARIRSAKAWHNAHRSRRALLVAECIINRMQNRHLKSADSFYLGNVVDLRDKFGRPRSPVTGERMEGFDVYNSSLDIFYMAKPAVNHQVGAAWKFTDSFLSKLDRVIDINADYKQLQRYFKPHQTPTAFDEVSTLHFDTGAIMKAVEDEDNGLIPRHRLTLFAIGVYSHLNQGVYPQYYRQNKTNRLYTIGSSSMQSVKREVRDHVLKGSGYHCYDMETAAFSILLHYVDNRKKYPAISAYIEHKKAQRIQVAIDTNADLELHVKPAITSVLFGAELENRYSKVNIPETIRKKIGRHPIIKAIKSELSKLKNDVTKKRNLTA